MTKTLLSFLLAVTGFVTHAQKLSYRLEMNKPQEHYFYVTMQVKEWKKPSLEVKMPVWAPGSYLVREFAKSVDYVKATSAGKQLKVTKTDKNTWLIDTKGATDVEVKYNVYAYETSVRTSYLDADHGFVSGTSVFMYIPDMLNKGGDLEIQLPAEFKKISTALPGSGSKYTYANMDELYDCPIEIGNHLEFDFMSSGCRHRVAMFGEGNFDIDRLKKDMALITDEATKVWGENPNKEYLFIVHNLTVGSGGLEHATSTTLDVSRNTYSGGSYYGFLSIVAHEYFHLWNVKRLRPAGLWPYNYDKENYTDLLWISEGFTSYYDELLLKRAGFYSENDYIRSLNSTLSSVENQPGSHVQSLADASFDAWIKSYRPNENSSNRTISYYPKGALVGAMLDIEIIASTNGKMRLDDLLRKLYNDFYKVRKTGFTFADFKKYAEDMCSKKLDDFFNTFVLTANDIDYNQYLNRVGYKLNTSSKSNEAWLGASTKDDKGRCIVTGVTDKSAAQAYGIYVNDEIIAVNGVRVDNNSLRTAVSNAAASGSDLTFLINRDNLVKTVTLQLSPNLQKDYSIVQDTKTWDATEKIRSRWLE